LNDDDSHPTERITCIEIETAAYSEFGGRCLGRFRATRIGTIRMA